MYLLVYHVFVLPSHVYCFSLNNQMLVFHQCASLRGACRAYWRKTEEEHIILSIKCSDCSHLTLTLNSNGVVVCSLSGASVLCHHI